ncbi:MAG TPA: glycosyltransferase family 4 protein [Vicinamibacterales bacterium]|nr:glycosyltransferase family 4 protein [Vicinamibacterales bacterium]
MRGTTGQTAVADSGRSGLCVLYVSYDGMLEPLGQSQVLPYLRELAARGARITLLSFEKRADLADRVRVDALGAQLAAGGIRWLRLRYHKRPRALATAADIAVGFARAVFVARRNRISAVHARSYVPALIAWGLKRTIGTRFIFDMRGFWADERVDGGLWPAGGRIYRVAKWLEHRFLRDADEIVTLTARARAIVEQWKGIGSPRVTVIPTCADLSRYPRVRRTTASDAGAVFVYSGSLGTWYLLREMIRFVEVARERWPGSSLLLLTRHQAEAREALQRSSLPADRVTLASAAPEEVPQWLARSDVGLAFYKPGIARRGTCPTKMAEYLAAGLPVVVNEAVGDSEEIIAGNEVGVVPESFSDEVYASTLDRLAELRADPELPVRCRSVAEAHFSLPLGVARYWDVYERIA